LITDELSANPIEWAKISLRDIHAFNLPSWCTKGRGRREIRENFRLRFKIILDNSGVDRGIGSLLSSLFLPNMRRTVLSREELTVPIRVTNLAMDKNK
jgi:hypothetical protein